MKQSLVLALLFSMTVMVAAQPTPPEAPTIVYFTPVDTPTVLPVTDRHLVATLNLRRLHTWKAVLDFEADSSIEVFLIDPAALPDVDPDWTMTAYQRGVVIGGFNILGAKMAALVGNPCLGRNGFADTTPNYLLVQMHVTWAEGADTARLDPQPFERCVFGTPAPALDGATSVHFAQSADTFDSAALFDQFQAVLETCLGEPSE
jgi:hypothetical protein